MYIIRERLEANLMKINTIIITQMLVCGSKSWISTKEQIRGIEIAEKHFLTAHK
jgi:hypothetical protein